MRICLVSREFPPDTGWGGVGAYTYQIAHALAARGHEVHVITLAGASQLSSTRTIGGVVEHRVAYQHILDELNLFLISAPHAHYVIGTTIALWKQFVELHSIEPFDVVEAPEHLAGGLFQAITGIVPTVLKLHTPHSKFVAEKFHGVLPNFDHQVICLLERITMMSADALCSPSSELAAFVASDLGISTAKIDIVRNPVDLDAFNPRGHRSITDNGKLIVLFVGRLEERKGIRHFVEAIPQVIERHKNVRFVAIGADTNTAPNNQSMLAYLQDQLRQTGCTAAVDFISHVPLSVMPDYYRSADICVVPSLYDNAPYTCIEAMACGKPVVTTTAGGSKEYVTNGESGFVVSPGASNELADAICELIANQRMRTQFGNQAREFVASELDRDKIAREMEAVYATAQRNFERQEAWYQKTPNKALYDALQLLCAYDEMMFETLYKQSFEFRLKHWIRFLKARPGLCIASIIASRARRIAKLFGPNTQLPGPLAKLERSVNAKTSGRYGLTMLLAQHSVQTQSAVKTDKVLA